ncbi:acyl-CoA thioesterase [Pseudomonas veronii]|uniref:acyl-CoA thioesterase n=1 Tax=Pseudomonas veronii TaxID=76761 RepID=UPI0021BDF88C|nr:thioesterase family protein [Pseudomonas veronii]MCT9826640.1 acyl-CoA thioesterase [Pseudomonas veronii]
MTDLRQRDRYKHFTPITTRWHDNDLYGHVNNVIYYGFFDSAVNGVLIERGGLDIHNGVVIGLVVSSSCDYHAPVAFPQRLEVALAVSRLGNSSVQYQLAVFCEGQALACATGRFVHVFVDRLECRPVPIPKRLRLALSELTCDTAIAIRAAV